VTDDYFSIAAGPAETDADGVLTTRVVLAGSFDIGARDDLSDALAGVVEAGPGDRIVVDLAGVRFIDSEAISALIEGYLAAEGAGVSFRFARAAGIVKRVLTIVGLTHLMDP
jgi:anti-anti-sigma factor